MFGLLTFVIPQELAALVESLLGLDWPAAILSGAMFASNTRPAHSAASRVGIARKLAVKSGRAWHHRKPWCLWGARPARFLPNCATLSAQFVTNIKHILWDFPTGHRRSRTSG